MEKGDLVKFFYKDGAISSFIGIFLSEGNHHNVGWVEIYSNNKKLKLYKNDYVFEVINGNR